MKIENHLFADNPKEFFRSYLIEDSMELHHGMKRPAMIVCPGGAYNFLSDREAEPIALTFSARGYQTFLLNYRVGSGKGDEVKVLPDALRQFGQTVKEIRLHADEWNVDPNKICIIGFSAGAHLCACYSGMWHTEWMQREVGATEEELRPNLAVLNYPVIDCEEIYHQIEKWGPSWPEEPMAIDGMMMAMAGEIHPSTDPADYAEYGNRVIYQPTTYVSKKTPPTFITHSADDYFIYVEDTLQYTNALADLRIPFEVHIFGRGGHGFALANEITSNEPNQSNPQNEKWVDLVSYWLKDNL